MHEYFYFVATLPALLLSEAPPLDATEFLRQAEGILDSDDLFAAKALLAGEWETVPHPFAERWRSIEIQLRNAIARARTMHGPGEAVASPRPHEGFDLSIERETAEAFQRKDPLERERALDRLRWRLVDELVGVEKPFSADVVMAYALRLSWVVRQSAWQPKAGRDHFTLTRDAAIPPDWSTVVGGARPIETEQDEET